MIQLIEDSSRLKLTQYVPEWEELSLATAESNVFYEPTMVLSALDNWPDKNIKFLFIYSGKTLIAFFPLTIKRVFKKMPLRHLSSFTYPLCMYWQPLIRDGSETEAVSKLMQWFVTDRKELFVNFTEFGGETKFASELAKYTSYEYYTYLRPILNSKQNYQDYIAETFSGTSRKKLRRKSENLQMQGVVALESEATKGSAWCLENFFKLESLGWKGKSGSALILNKEQQHFVRTVAEDYAKKNRFYSRALLLNTLPISMEIGFITGNKNFSFKIAYDERHAKLSPGMLLEIESIKCAINNKQIIDTCSTDNSILLNRVFKERKRISSFILATGSRSVYVHIIRSLLWIFRKIYKRSKVDIPDLIER